jgi:Gas vesicle protein
MSVEAHAFGDGTLVDLLDRLLAGGVVVAGDVTLAVADIDLVRVRLLALVSSVATAAPESPAGSD